jgi:3-oxoacyl-[acyl-carrier-protein] synthase II
MKTRIIQGHRVAITGMGVISPVGLTVASFWDSLIHGLSGIAPIQDLDLTGLEVSVAAQLKCFDPLLYIDRKEVRRNDRFCQLAIAAAREAMDNSSLDITTYGADRVGAVIGNGGFGLETIESEYFKLFSRGPSRISPLAVPMIIGNMAAAKIAMVYGMTGANFCITTACASGTHSIGEAFRMIKYGHLDACITGGTEAPITRFSLASYNNMTALTRETDPTCASIPFDARRSGFVVGEGAGILVLENLNLALARGAKIICEVVGFGATSDAYHITCPDSEGKGAAKAMTLAMQESGVLPDAIDYINAHGTSTPINDKTETLAIKRAFGESAGRVAISSTKSMTGHLLGAAGAVEAIATALALRDGIIPPTIGYQVPDLDCDLDYVPHFARRKPMQLALSNSFGFGGQNGVLCLKKWED